MLCSAHHHANRCCIRWRVFAEIDQHDIGEEGDKRPGSQRRDQLLKVGGM
jgi:hypothetical protein